MNLREKIINEFGGLSPELQRAAEFSLQNASQLVVLSMRAFAAEAGVKPATLLRLAQSHLSKIGGGAAVYYDKMITELLGDVTQSYPPRLSLQDQGIFQIGYYHQKQKLFTKKEEKDNG